MTTKNQAKSEPKSARKAKKPRNVVVVCPRDENESPDDACARVLTAPSLQAAATIQQWEGDDQEVNALAKELTKQIARVNTGDLGRAEGMLIAQAHTLDELFNNLARRAYPNLGEYINAAETYLRLALKAQSQCRATLETLAAIKNPPIVFARQANVTTGPQQIHNGTATSSRAGEIENEQSQLSGSGNELLPDGSASALASAVNSTLEAVGKINRAKIGRG